MQRGWWMGVAACLALSACAADGGEYYSGSQSSFDSYGPSGYIVSEPTYVQPYGYGAPFRPGYGYGRDREFRDRDFRAREYRNREFRDSEFRDRQSRADQERFNRDRGNQERFDRGEQFRRQDDQMRQQQNRAPPQQTGPIQGGLFPGVPRPMSQ